MTENEFKLCSLLFYTKFKGKNLKDVVEENKYFRPVNVIIDNPSFDHKHKFFRNLQSDRTLLYFSHNELRIDGFGNNISKNYNSFETFDIFLKTFGISFEDIV